MFLVLFFFTPCVVLGFEKGSQNASLAGLKTYHVPRDNLELMTLLPLPPFLYTDHVGIELNRDPLVSASARVEIKA